jgi:hypothetical protein
LGNQPLSGPTHLTVIAPLGCTPRFLRRGYPLPRFVDPFDTFDEGSQATVGHLSDDLEVWLYPGQINAPFSLFDGTLLVCDARPTQGGAHSIQWKIFE